MNNGKAIMVHISRKVNVFCYNNKNIRFVFCAAKFLLVSYRTRICLFSLGIYNAHWHFGCLSAHPSPPVWVYSLSSWQRRTCRLVFMVSCDPAPPPQCSWFSSKEKERGKMKLSPQVSKSHSSRGQVSVRYTVIMSELSRHRKGIADR